MLDINKYDEDKVSVEEMSEMGKLVTEAQHKRDLEKDGKMQIYITMDVKESQALALKEFFECWNSLASMGSSREVSFFVDGDGDFKPNCQISFSKEPDALSIPEEELKYILKSARVSEDGKEPIAFDYDPVGWKLRTYKFKYKCIDNTINTKLNGYFLGVQKGYHVDVPDFGSFKMDVGIRGMIPIWCRVMPEVISIHQQKYNDAIDGYQPYDWEEEKYIPFEKFKNYPIQTPNSLSDAK